MVEMSAFDFFRSESSHVDVVARAEAMSKIKYILALMEPDKVRSEMIPYLQTKNKEVDQVLLALAQRIGDFVKYIGGPEYSPVLIPTLEYLCSAEETAVRSAASTSTTKIMATLSSSHKSQAQEFLELFKRLSNDENPDVFYNRISACHIISELYRISESSDRSTIREIYTKLMNDEISLVKRAASVNMIPLAKNAEPDVLSGELFQLFKKMVTDELTTVKVTSTETLVPFVKLLQKNDRLRSLTVEIVPIIRSCFEDLSWRMRLGLSKDYFDLADCFEPSVISSDVFPGVLAFLQDIEPDIRKNAVKSLIYFVPAIGVPTFLNDALPLMSTLISDPVSDVRKVLAEAVIDVSVKLTVDQVNQHCLELITRIMNDEDPLVKLRIVQKIPTIAEHMPYLFVKLVELFKGCLVDVNWRLRKGQVLVLPSVIKFMGPEYFSEHFLTLYLNLLKDSVSEVRQACTEVVSHLINACNTSQKTPISGADFIHSNVFPTVKSMGTDEYVVRLSMLTVLDGLLRTKDLPEHFRTEVVQMLVNASNDKVANIRIRSAQVMASVGKCAYPENVKGYIKLILTNLQSDKDKDVRYFTAEALQEFQ